MGTIGRKKKAGSGRNKRGRSTPKAKYYGNGNDQSDETIENKTDSVAELVSPPIGPVTVGVSQEEVVRPNTTTAQALNDTPNNQPCTPVAVTSFENDVRNIFFKIFRKERLPVADVCAKESGERLEVTFGLTKEAFLRYLTVAEKNNNVVDVSPIDVPTINFDSFKCDGRNNKSAQKARERAATKIVTSVENAGSECQQVLALYKAMSHPRLGVVAKAAGFMSNAPLLTFQRQNVIQILRDARNKKGRANNERSQFSESLLVAISAIPNETPEYSLRKQAKSLGLKKSQGVLLLQNAAKKRKVLVDTGEYGRLRKKAKRKSIYSDEFLTSLTDWVTNHPFVRVSPIANDTLLINGVRVPKLLREAPIREMHNDMIKDAADGGLPGAILLATGKPIMSDTELRRQLRKLLPELKKATLRHKKMCGCENCIGIAYLHEALNRFRLRKRRHLEDEASALKEEVRSCNNLRAKGRLQTRYLSAVVNADDYAEYAFPDGQPLHPKPRNALNMIMCEPVESCDNLRKWKCVLGKCNDCPKAQFHPLELSTNEDVDNAVRFQHYENYTKCSQHGVLELRSKKCDRCEDEVNTRTKVGKIRTRSELTLSEKSIGVFLTETYLPLLEKYRYHHPHVQILSKHIIGTKRHETFKSLLHALFTKRDFAEAIQAAMHNEVQGDHFGKIRKMILEGSCVEYFSAALGKLTKEFHSHLSDDAAQCAATSFENMYVVLERLKEKGLLHENSTVIYDHTDGCTCQYRCATALYFLSMLSFMFKLTIDRMIHAPGHGKDEVDGLNATTKRFLQQKMSTTNLNNDQGEEKRMDPWAMEGGSSKCLSSEAKRLLEEPERKDGVVSAGKYKKRFDSRAVTERTYHVLGGEEVRFKNLKMKTIQFKKEPGTKNGLMTRYNFRTDPNLGVGKVAIRRIPCPCASCNEQLRKAWKTNVPAKEQERYAVNESCENWPIFEGLNNWEVVNILPGGETNDEEEMEGIFTTILENIADVMARDIGEGGIGAIGTDDPCQYYLLQWTGLPFRLPEEVVENGDRFKQNEHVCRARYLEKLPRTTKWYYRVPANEEFTVRLQTVLAADIQLVPASDTNKLPTYWRGRRAANPTLVEDTRLTDTDHDNLLAELERRQVFDYEESFSDTDSGSDDSNSDDDDDDDSSSDEDDSVNE
jgi:hypothetical protein